MSKYSDNMEKQYKDIKKLREATRDSIKGGSKLALEKYHDAKSLERLKREIRKSKK